MGVMLNKKHLGTGLLVEKELYLGSGEKRTVQLEITPREARSSNLLIFVLRREVISDVTTRGMDVNP